MSLSKVSFSMIQGATLNVVDFGGADTGAKIIAAIATLPATGGTVDCRGLEGDQIISSTVEIGGATKPVTLLCGDGATFKPSAANVQMFRIKPNGKLIGARINTTDVTYASTTILLNDSFTDGQLTQVKGIVCVGTVNEGVAIQLETTGATTYGIAFVTLDSIRIQGYFAGIAVSVNDASQFVNSNVFSNIEVKASNIGYNTAGSGFFYANQFINCTYQAAPPANAIGFNFTTGEFNTLLNTNIWDMTAGSNEFVFGSETSRNIIAGYLNAVNAIDNGIVNVVKDITTGTLPVAGEVQSFTTPAATWGLNFAPSGSAPTLISIASGNTYDLAVGSGLVMLHNISTGNLGLFIAAAEATAIVSDPGSIYSITQGTALSTNFFYNAGTGKYRIENNTGGVESYFVGLIKTKNSV